jgi:hypothetical protein
MSKAHEFADYFWQRWDQVPIMPEPRFTNAWERIKAETIEKFGAEHAEAGMAEVQRILDNCNKR